MNAEVLAPPPEYQQSVDQLTACPSGVVLVLGGGENRQGDLNERSKINTQAAIAIALAMSSSHFFRTAFIFSGGLKEGKLSEAEQMEKQFIDKCRQAGRLPLNAYIDEESLNTKQNISATAKALKRVGYEGKVFVIADETHIDRTLKLSNTENEIVFDGISSEEILRELGGAQHFVGSKDDLRLLTEEELASGKAKAEKQISKYHESSAFKGRAAREIVHRVMGELPKGEITIEVIINAIRKAKRVKRQQYQPS